MKFSLIAAIALFALAQGSFAQEASELDKLTQFFDDLKTKVTQEVAEILRTQDLANQAQTFLEEKKTQLEPLATQIQDQLRTAAATVEEQIKPLSASVQAQLLPVVDSFQKQMELILQRLTENRGIAN